MPDNKYPVTRAPGSVKPGGPGDNSTPKKPQPQPPTKPV